MQHQMRRSLLVSACIRRAVVPDGDFPIGFNDGFLAARPAVNLRNDGRAIDQHALLRGLAKRSVGNGWLNALDQVKPGAAVADVDILDGRKRRLAMRLLRLFQQGQRLGLAGGALGCPSSSKLSRIAATACVRCKSD